MFTLQDFLFDPQKPMLFNSALFYALFIVFVLVYAFIHHRKSLIYAWVLGFSWYFYYKSSGIFLGLFFITLIKDYFFALWLEKSNSSYAKKCILWTSIVSSLGVLFYFKYTNFIFGNLFELIQVKFNPLELVLPIGISFYTFQSISYISDVYQKRIRATHDFGDYAFYMSFFPHLVAGPIVKSNHFLPQLKKPIFLKHEWVWSGFLLIVGGLFKKAVVADYISQYNDLVFADPSKYTAWECLFAIYGYALQIYCDFSGYSDMAIGIARVLGFDLGLNFSHPYSSLNLTEFWRRWHISLSSWLREYLYIPLGGNRKGKIRTYIHLFITMLLGGLWHGASWNFILWGGAHGGGLAIHKFFDSSVLSRWMRKIPLWSLWAWLLTFHFVVLLWIFFRASSFDIAGQMLGQLWLSSWDPAYLYQFIEVRYTWIILFALGSISHFLPENSRKSAIRLFVDAPLIIKLALFIFVCQLVLQFRNENVQPFIYFQF